MEKIDTIAELHELIKAYQDESAQFIKEIRYYTTEMGYPVLKNQLTEKYSDKINNRSFFKWLMWRYSAGIELRYYAIREKIHPQKDFNDQDCLWHVLVGEHCNEMMSASPHYVKMNSILKQFIDIYNQNSEHHIDTWDIDRSSPWWSALLGITFVNVEYILFPERVWTPVDEKAYKSIVDKKLLFNPMEAFGVLCATILESILSDINSRISECTGRMSFFADKIQKE